PDQDHPLRARRRSRRLRDVGPVGSVEGRSQGAEQPHLEHLSPQHAAAVEMRNDLGIVLHGVLPRAWSSGFRRQSRNPPAAPLSPPPSSSWLACESRGSQTKKVEPLPKSLSTQIRPPWPSTRCRVSQRPR